MTATYPTDAGDEYPPVAIEDDYIRIESCHFPARIIAANSVELQPGTLVNQITLTLFVGEVSISDEALRKVSVRPPADRISAQCQIL